MERGITRGAESSGEWCNIFNEEKGKSYEMNYKFSENENYIENDINFTLMYQW